MDLLLYTSGHSDKLNCFPAQPLVKLTESNGPDGFSDCQTAALIVGFIGQLGTKVSARRAPKLPLSLVVSRVKLSRYLQLTKDDKRAREE